VVPFAEVVPTVVQFGLPVMRSWTVVVAPVAPRVHPSVSLVEVGFDSVKLLGAGSWAIVNCPVALFSGQAVSASSTIEAVSEAEDPERLFRIVAPASLELVIDAAPLAAHPKCGVSPSLEIVAMTDSEPPDWSVPEVGFKETVGKTKSCVTVGATVRKL